MEIPLNQEQQPKNQYLDPQSQPTFLKICTNLAICLENRNKREKALQILKTLANNEKFSNDQRLCYNLGIMYQRDGQYGKAKEYLEKASNFQGMITHEFGVVFNLAVTNMQSQHIDTAETMFLKSMDIIKEIESQKDKQLNSNFDIL